MSVTPDYLGGNGTSQYSPQTWLDEVVDESGEVIQEGTPLDAEHFTYMEQGIHNNSLLLAILEEEAKHIKSTVADVDGELIEKTLTNDNDFYFNNSATTIALTNSRSTLDYRVFVEVQDNPVNVGDVVIYDKQLNGFKIAYTGSAESVSLKLYVQGGN